MRRTLRNSPTLGALRAVAPPLGACCAALALLAGYTATGAAGDPPPRIEIVDARIIAPMGATSTAAYFEIRNTGASADTLQYADSPELGVSVIRRTVRRTGTGRTEPAWAVNVPPGGTIRMTPGGLGVVILDPPALKPGQSVRYNLWFRKSGRVGVQAPVTAGTN
jgi:hypothetical protein